MKLQQELTTSDLWQFAEDLKATGWDMHLVAGGALGPALLYELAHGRNMMYLMVSRDGGGKVVYELSEGPVIRDSLMR